MEICPFYSKIGACRHGDKCSRQHPPVVHGQTVMLTNAWLNPSFFKENKVPREDIKRMFDEFYEDMYCEACKFGPVYNVMVCDNACDHLMGNVYIKYKYEDDAAKAAASFNERWYDSRPVRAEVVPVVDFRDAVCRQLDSKDCRRGRLCNYVHPLDPPSSLVRDLDRSQRAYWESISHSKRRRYH